MSSFFITGASGTIGMSFLKKLLTLYPKSSFLVAGRNPLPSLFHPSIQHCHCDFSKADLGGILTKEKIKDITHVIHLAADVRWEQDKQTAYNVNVAGVERLADLFDGSQALKKFIFASTVYSHPPKRLAGIPIVASQDGYDFANFYEYSKYLAESYIRSLNNIPWQIVSFPLVLGDSHTGEIEHFIGTYLLYRFAIHDKIPFFVASKDSYVNIVPVDYVLDTLMEALLSDEIHKTYYINANYGRDRLEQLLNDSWNLLNRFFEKNHYRPLGHPQMIKPDIYYGSIRETIVPKNKSMMERIEFKKFESFIPYTCFAEPLDTRKADYVTEAPPLANFLPVCIDYWCKTEKRRFKNRIKVLETA